MRPPPTSELPPWSTYLDQFHAQRPGITERILIRCRADGLDPYAWCVEALSGLPGPVLDVACGSGPMQPQLPGWIGIDTAEAELAAAKAVGRGPLVRGSALALPMPGASFDAVVCSMAMQIIGPVDRALAEIASVLRTSGHAVLLLPASSPLGLRDLVLYARLEASLRQRIRYPNDRALRRPGLRAATESVGLVVRSDESQRFTLPLDTTDDADELLSSLYLPGVAPERMDLARRVLRAAVGRDVGVPLRRITLERTGAPA